MMNLTEVSDVALVAGLEGMCAEERGLLARMILHLMEVEERGLHLQAAYTSMFDFCTRRLGMSESAACRRLNAVRLARRFPRLLASIERGAVKLETLVLVRDHLTEESFDEVLAAVSGKGKREVAEILARRAPRPDAPSMMRKLPRSGGTIEPTSEDRYKLQIAASAELCAKVERARALMRHRNPSGDLSILVERAFDALIAKLEKERLGKSARPSRKAASGANAPAPSALHGRPGISRATRREVFERDGEQCTFVSREGLRCASRHLLELDHVEPYAQGGASDAANLRVLCRAHNALHAEERFGRRVVERMDLRRRRSMQRNATARGTGAHAARGAGAHAAGGAGAPEPNQPVTRMR